MHEISQFQNCRYKSYTHSPYFSTTNEKYERMRTFLHDFRTHSDHIKVLASLACELKLLLIQNFYVHLRYHINTNYDLAACSGNQ